MADHPITPPPELVRQWDSEAVSAKMPWQLYIATQAARWGADQELEACCAWLNEQRWTALSIHLRAFRRPKPSLGEQALLQVESYEGCLESIGIDVDTLRAALMRLTKLEALNDD
jgi:hypothetical protein